MLSKQLGHVVHWYVLVVVVVVVSSGGRGGGAIRQRNATHQVVRTLNKPGATTSRPVPRGGGGRVGTFCNTCDHDLSGRSLRVNKTSRGLIELGSKSSQETKAKPESEKKNTLSSSL